MRVDVFLTENGYSKSRQSAKNLISNSRLLINGEVCTKPSYDVKPTDSIQIVGEVV